MDSEKVPNEQDQTDCESCGDAEANHDERHEEIDIETDVTYGHSNEQEYVIPLVENGKKITVDDHEVVNRKRKLSDDQIDDKEIDSPRKRHCSGQVKVELEQNKPEENGEDLNEIESTQLMDSSQTQDVDSLTMTQVSMVTEQSEVKASDTRNKVKELREKLKRAKRRDAVDDIHTGSLPGTSQSTEIELYSRTGNQRTETMLMLEDVDRHVNSCRDIIEKMKYMFDDCESLRGNARVEAWRREIMDIEKRLVFPKTVIAVVGDTGSGKSSLMNAILDHRSVLPTSGMRACTAVVVEVVQNTTSTNFEADIKFLQKEEWFDELQILLKDLTGLDGTVRNGPPKPNSDAFVSYCKVMAVYGRIDRFEVLSRLTTVTHWLGTVKVITSTKPEDFRHKVAKYIETQDTGADEQYWPIVKHVCLRMPNCDVCSSGAALVDLPGLGDSNAARDKIANEYLKNCTAVWVVSSIHRAIDDKTAKELLGENFWRQLLMDGHYGNIAFIYTNTDILVPSEIIRQLGLEGKTKEHEDRVSEMESEKIELDRTVSGATRKLNTLTKKVKSLKKEAQELRDSQSEEKEAINEYQQELTLKEEELTEAGNQVEQLHDEKEEATRKTLELDKQLNVHRKAIAAICARARNEYSKSQIKQDFKAGLKEMKRRAGMMNSDGATEKEDIYSDDDDDGVGSNAENLKVFCCSSTEYQKMKKLLTDDGPPQVFSSLDDTQIPSLRHYVHEMTSIIRKQSMERLIRLLGRFVFDLQMYICEGRDMKTGNRQWAKSAIDAEIQKFDTTLTPVLQQLMGDIDAVFDGSIRPKMEEGSSNASSEANTTCAKWGAPTVSVNRDPNKDKQSGGLHWCTYRDTVRRHGIFTSPSYGPVDFNEDLSEPMYRSMTIVWDRAFSGILWKVLDKLKVDILGKLNEFIVQLVSQLEQWSIPQDRTQRVIQLHGSASNKLTEMVTHLKEMITSKQREISRVITPHIQSTLLPEYTICAAECGSGMYERMKTSMGQGIDSKRTSMFDEATKSLVSKLMDLQNEVVQYVRQACQTLMQDLRTAFEPLWEAPANSIFIRSAFQTPIREMCASMHQIYDEAGLSHTEEHGLVPAMPTTPGVPATVSVYPGESDQPVADSTDGWQCYDKTFQKQEDTPYGSMKQCGQLGVRVKTERLSENCVSETVQILHTKQERLDTDYGNIDQLPPTIDQSLLGFGCRTLQDLQCVKLEMSPLETTINSTSISSTVASEPAPSVVPASVHSSKHSASNRNQVHVVTALPSCSTPLSNLAQYGIVETLPDGKTVMMESLISGLLIPKSKVPTTCTYTPTNSIYTPSNSCVVPNCAQEQAALFQSSTGASPSAHAPSRISDGNLGIQTKRVNTPSLNMVIGQENVGGACGRGDTRYSQPRTNNNRLPKGKKRDSRTNLSLSQSSPAATTVTPPVIKTEPVCSGVYGRVKYLGTIDLTDD